MKRQNITMPVKFIVDKTKQEFNVVQVSRIGQAIILTCDSVIKGIDDVKPDYFITVQTLHCNCTPVGGDAIRFLADVVYSDIVSSSGHIEKCYKATNLLTKIKVATNETASQWGVISATDKEVILHQSFRELIHAVELIIKIINKGDGRIYP